MGLDFLRAVGAKIDLPSASLEINHERVQAIYKSSARSPSHMILVAEDTTVPGNTGQLVKISVFPQVEGQVLLTSAVSSETHIAAANCLVEGEKGIIEVLNMGLDDF